MNNDKIAEYIDGATTYNRWHDHNFEGGVVSIPHNEFIQEVEEIDENMYDAETIASKYGKSFVAGYAGGEAVVGEIERIVYSFGASCKSKEFKMVAAKIVYDKAGKALEILEALWMVYDDKHLDDDPNNEVEEAFEASIDRMKSVIDDAITHYEEVASDNNYNDDYDDYDDSFMDY